MFKFRNGHCPICRVIWEQPIVMHFNTQSVRYEIAEPSARASARQNSREVPQQNRVNPITEDDAINGGINDPRINQANQATNEQLNEQYLEQHIVVQLPWPNLPRGARRVHLILRRRELDVFVHRQQP